MLGTVYSSLIYTKLHGIRWSAVFKMPLVVKNANTGPTPYLFSDKPLPPIGFSMLFLLVSKYDVFRACYSAAAAHLQ